MGRVKKNKHGDFVDQYHTVVTTFHTPEGVKIKQHDCIGTSGYSSDMAGRHVWQRIRDKYGYGCQLSAQAFEVSDAVVPADVRRLSD